MAKLFDRVGQATATTGTGTLTLGAVITDATNGDLATFADMGAVATDVVNYLIVDGNNWEIGTGTLGGTGPGFTLTRTVTKSKISGTVGTTALTLSGSAKVYSIPSRLLDFSAKRLIAPYSVYSAANPQLGDEFGNGLGFTNGNGIYISVGGSSAASVDFTGFFVGSNRCLGFTPSTADNGSPDVMFWRAASNTMAMAHGTAAQTLQIFGSIDTTSGVPTTNFSRLSLKHLGSTLGATIATEAGGTGTAGNLSLQPGSGIVSLGGNTSSFPALKQSGNAIYARLADDSAYADFRCANLNVSGGLNCVDVFSTGAYRGATAYEQTQGTLTDASTIAWDVRAKQSAIVTLTSAIGSTRILGNPTNMVAGTTYILVVKQDATGSRALTYGTAYKWPGGSAPVLSTAASAIDVLTFVYDGTSMLGVAQKAFA